MSNYLTIGPHLDSAYKSEITKNNTVQTSILTTSIGINTKEEKLNKNEEISVYNQFSNRIDFL